jgi:uridylate kinase
MWARNFKARTILNLSNIDYVFNKDPKYHKDAKRFERISWKEFRRIVGSEWDPGLNAPFDPIASKEAQRLGLEVVIINGRNLENLESFLNGKKYKGTVIR